LFAGETEEGVFEALGLKCPKPEEREVVEKNLCGSAFETGAKVEVKKE
jgi:hypothetical protein